MDENALKETEFPFYIDISTFLWARAPNCDAHLPHRSDDFDEWMDENVGRCGREYIFKWIKTFGDCYHEDASCIEHLYYFFKNMNDLILFKLRWG